MDKKEKEKTMPTGISLFAWNKEEVYIWCKHQANLHHQTRKRVVSGGQEVLKRAMCTFCVTFY